MKSGPAEQYLSRHVTTRRTWYRRSGKLQDAATRRGKSYA